MHARRVRRAEISIFSLATPHPNPPLMMHAHRSAPFAILVAILTLLTACRKEESTPPDDDTATNPYGTGNGAVSFYLTATVPYNSNVSLGGVGVGELTQYFPLDNNGQQLVPVCGQVSGPSMITQTRPAGTYTWCNTLNNGDTYTGTVLVVEGVCSTVGIHSAYAGNCSGGGGGGGGGQGIVTFFMQNDQGHGPVVIKVDGFSVGTLTTVHPNGPTCGSGQVNVQRSEGLHNWSALAQDGYHYEGSIYWPGDGDCVTQQVETLLSPPAVTYGTLTFWCLYDFSGIPVDVYVDGQYRGQITGAHTSGVTCGQGYVNMQLTSGTHSWNTVDYQGVGENGTVNILANDCSTIMISP